MQTADRILSQKGGDKKKCQFDLREAYPESIFICCVDFSRGPVHTWHLHSGQLGRRHRMHLHIPQAKKHLRRGYGTLAPAQIVNAAQAVQV